MLIDSHCHLPHLAGESAKILENARESGVVGYINIGTSITENGAALKVAESFTNVYSTVAIYPHENLDKSLTELENHLRKLLDTHNKKIVAVGECGIDISKLEGGRNVQAQIELFDMQIKLALDYNLPLVIHNRNGDEQVMQLLTKYATHNLRGVAHCFASTWDTAQRYLDLGFYISFSGLITYPSRKALLETVQKVPTDRFVVETDAPCLSPQGFRGQPNEPKYVKIVAQKVAEVRGEPFDVVSNYSFDNTCRIFKIEI